MLDWDDMRVFLAVHRSVTLAAAGTSLGINATTVGRRLNTLEEQAGARLFDRTPDGYIATLAGRDLLPAAERMEAEMLAVERQIVGADKRPAGVVRVATTEMLATRIIATALPRFRDQYPEISLDLQCSNRPVLLGRREADIALRLSKPHEPCVVSRKLARIHLGLYASPAYLAAHGSPAEPDRQLDGKHAILFADTHTFALENGWFSERLGKARIVLRSDSVSAAYAACAAGLGIALLPRVVAGSDPDLVLLATSTSPEPRVIYQIVHEDLVSSARIDAVRQFLAEVFREPEPVPNRAI